MLGHLKGKRGLSVWWSWNRIAGREYLSRGAHQADGKRERWGQNKVETPIRILPICWRGATREHPQWTRWKRIAFPDLALEFTGHHFCHCHSPARI